MIRQPGHSLYTRNRPPEHEGNFTSISPKIIESGYIPTRAIIRALQNNRGMVYLAADELDCNPSVILRRANEEPEIAEVVEAERERMVDFAEITLYDKILMGETKSLHYFLSRKAKHRGYSDSQEVVGSGGGPIEVTFNLGGNGEEDEDE